MLTMTKPIKKISLFLLIIILLPILFISIREILSFNEDENVIGEIYNKQLESILFSVNQYSEDVTRSWLVRYQSYIDEAQGSEKLLKSKLKGLLDNNLALETVFYADSLGNINFIYRLDENSSAAGQEISELKKVLGDSKRIIDRLFNYKSANYTKIEPVVYSSAQKEILIFVLNNRNIGGFIIDKNLFVTQNLSSVIQSIAKDEFAVSVFNSKSLQNIYSAEQTDARQFQQKKSLWLIPDYSLGIVLKGKTVESLVKERIFRNLIIIILLTVLMVVIAWIGYKNVRREVELAQIKSEFVSNVSHELRTPLSLISMFTETLSMGRVQSEEKRNEYYGIIHQETERLSKIVNKILNFSKIEAGKWKYNFTTVDLNSIAFTVFDNYKFHLQQNGFSFSFDKYKEPLEIIADPESLSEAIINLIDNAIKYSGENKSVTLKTGNDDGHAFVEVMDSGVGISAEEQKKIFDKFYRATSDNVHNTKGTGLGLTLVKHIVDAHKGEIILTSEPGKGSAFRIIFKMANNI